MRLIGLAGLVGACLATSPLFAADLFDSAPPPMDMPQPQAELGSNWYIRGDVGYGQIDEATVVPSAGLFPAVGNAPIGDSGTPVAATRGNNQTSWTPDFDLGFGYRVNDWFRVDATWQFTQGPGLGTTQTVYCPEEATGNANGSGYYYDYTKCDGNLNVKQYNNTGIVMGYIDLGHWGLFTPFIGAGAGLNANTISGALTFNQQDTGLTYAGVTSVSNGASPTTPLAIWEDPNGTPLSHAGSGTPQPIGPANWNRTISSTKYTFAGALAAGVGIKISQSATLDLAYKIMTLDLSGGMKNTLQSVNLGVRYDLN